VLPRLGYKRQKEWDQEPEQVEFEHQLQEPFGCKELEINDLSHGLKLVKIDLMVWLNVEDTG
jgi:hypothetical protein